MADLWDAVTNRERLVRWFSPVSGDLQLGGRYAIEGNASGTIEACEPPERLFLTWEFAGQVSWVEARIDEAGDGARLTITHLMPADADDEHWVRYGPGAAGVGWELGLLGLAMHCENPAAPRPDETEFFANPDAKALIRGSAAAWGQVHAASGEDPEHARRSAQATAAFYTGE